MIPRGPLTLEIKWKTRGLEDKGGLLWWPNQAMPPLPSAQGCHSIAGLGTRVAKNSQRKGPGLSPLENGAI